MAVTKTPINLINDGTTNWGEDKQNVNLTALKTDLDNVIDQSNLYETSKTDESTLTDKSKVVNLGDGSKVNDDIIVTETNPVLNGEATGTATTTTTGVGNENKLIKTDDKGVLNQYNGLEDLGLSDSDFTTTDKYTELVKIADAMKANSTSVITIFEDTLPNLSEVLLILFSKNISPKSIFTSKKNKKKEANAPHLYI